VHAQFPGIYYAVERDMNEDTLKGQWKQLKGRVGERWGIERDEAKRQIDAWLRGDRPPVTAA
jgi:hypothetical protein